MGISAAFVEVHVFLNFNVSNPCDYHSLRIIAIDVSMYSPQWVKSMREMKTKSRLKCFIGANFQSV